MSAYYNEIDKKAAAWLRELIAQGIIAPGDVDERSIVDVEPADLVGYTQCHFFAGIGGWSIAARLAGWPDDRPMWSASCPCQPFSVAGKGEGTADPRHLWPDFFRLARAVRPAFIVGEQVAAAVGKDWFLGVRSDLESIGYVGRGIVVPACAVNAPHRRDRLWFAAGSGLLEDTAGVGNGCAIQCGETDRSLTVRPTGGVARSGDCNRSDLGDSYRLHVEGVERGCVDTQVRQESGQRPTGSLCAGDGAVSDTERQRIRGQGCTDPDGSPEQVQGIDGERKWIRSDAGTVRLSGVSDVAHHNSSGRSAGIDNTTAGHGHSVAAASRAGAWDTSRWLVGYDGKARRVEPSIPLLVDGLPARAPLLRGYGNAIVPQVAAEVIGAWMDCDGDLT